MKPLLSLAFLLRRSLSKYLLNVQYARDCPKHILNLYSHCMRRLPLFQLRNDGFGEVGCLVQGAWTLFTVSRAGAAFPVSPACPVPTRSQREGGKPTAHGLCPPGAWHPVRRRSVLMCSNGTQIYTVFCFLNCFQRQCSGAGPEGASAQR